MTKCVHCGQWVVFSCRCLEPIWGAFIDVPPVPEGDRVLEGDPGQWTEVQPLEDWCTPNGAIEELVDLTILEYPE